MKEVVITGIEVEDRRFDLENGAGSDAVHTVPVYAYAVCRLKTNGPLDGVGLAFTLGSGNDLVCRAIEYLSESLVGREIHELMSDYGAVFAALAGYLLAFGTSRLVKHFLVVTTTAFSCSLML